MMDMHDALMSIWGKYIHSLAIEVEAMVYEPDNLSDYARGTCPLTQLLTTHEAAEASDKLIRWGKRFRRMRHQRRSVTKR